MTARTISLAVLLARVPDATDIELPGPEGGWAVAVINGREYRARVLAVAEVCQACREGVPAYIAACTCPVRAEES